MRTDAAMKTIHKRRRPAPPEKHPRFWPQREAVLAHLGQALADLLPQHLDLLSGHHLSSAS
jgi:hypothetical protein